MRVLGRSLVPLQRSTDRAEQRASLLSMVVQAARDMSTLEPDAVLAAVVNCVLELGFEAANFCLFENGTRSYHIAYARGLPDDYVRDGVHPTAGIARLVSEGRQAVLVRDYPSLPDAVPQLVEAGFLTLLSAPIWSSGELAGVLVGDAKRPLDLGSEYLEAFELLAAHAGLALTNARRFERERAAVRELAELRDRQQQTLSLLEATLDSTADGILVVDPNRKLVRFNRRFAEMWHISQRMIGDGDPEAIRAHLLAQLTDEYRDGVLEGAVLRSPDARGSDLLSLRDGRVFERSWQSQRIDERIVGRVWTFRDTTERAAAERALRESEERYRTLFQSVPVGLLRTSPEGEIVDANPAVAEMLGYRNREEVLSIRADEIYEDPADRARLIALLERQDVAPDFETRFVRADGATIWVRLNVRAMRDESGGIVRLEGSIRDVTSEKLADQELKEAFRKEQEAGERLRALDEMKNTFLSAVSHELRTPLTSVLGFALTLERDDIELGPEERVDLVRRLASNARRLDRLLSDLLDLDRLARGTVEPHRKDTDLRALVTGVVKHAESAGHPVIVEAEALTAFVDGPKVERIVENLVVNAVRHTPAGTRIWVRLHAVPQGVLLVVEDEGPGIPLHLRQELFNPFERGPTPGPGTGIGLSLVARFAELHGGGAWVEERPGGGASFQVLLPSGEPTERA